MAERYAPSSSSNGSQYSSDSGALGSRRGSCRRRRTDYHYDERVVDAGMYGHPSRMSQQGYVNCSRCRESLTSPYTSFCFDLDLRDVVTLDRPTPRLLRDVHELLKQINALLNDCGGTVCVHCSPSRSVSLMDQLLDDRLTALIANATLYDDNFERRVTDDQHVIYRVKPTQDRRISTLDFHSMLSGNQGLTHPTQAQIQTLVRNCSRSTSGPEPSPTDRYGDTVPRFEYLKSVRLAPSCRLHFHRVDCSTLEAKTDENYGTQVVGYWWQDLSLGKYIAALCKQQGGGSVYLGVAEEVAEPRKAWRVVQNCDLGLIFPGTAKKLWETAANDPSQVSRVHHLANEEDVPEVEGRRTGVYVCYGVELNRRERSALQAALFQKMQTEMLWYPQYPATEPLRVNFHPVQGGQSDLYVVEVVVSKFYGLAFHDKQGPEAYTIRPAGQKYKVRQLDVQEFMREVNGFPSPHDLYEESEA